MKRIECQKLDFTERAEEFILLKKKKKKEKKTKRKKKEERKKLTSCRCVGTSYPWNVLW